MGPVCDGQTNHGGSRTAGGRPTQWTTGICCMLTYANTRTRHERVFARLQGVHLYSASANSYTTFGTLKFCSFDCASSRDSKARLSHMISHQCKAPARASRAMRIAIGAVQRHRRAMRINHRPTRLVYAMSMPHGVCHEYYATSMPPGGHAVVSGRI
jgi:hypothetical protein